MLKPCLVVTSVAMLAMVSPGDWACGAGPGPRAATEFAAWSRMQLVPAWSRVAQLDQNQDRVKLVQIHAQSQSTYPVYEVVSPLGSESFSSRQTDHLSNPIGEAEMKRRAEQRVRDLQAMEYQAELKSSEITEVRVYIQTRQGVLQALDGESGRILWSVQPGLSGDRVFPVAIGDQTVAATTSNTAFLIDAATGAELWTSPLRGVAQSGPAFTDRIFITPLLSGQVDGLWLPRSDGQRLPPVPAVFIGSGRVTAAPVVQGNLSAWSTDQGVTFIASLDPPRTRFRIRTAPIWAPLAFRSATELIVIDERGYIQAFDAQEGRTLWQTSTGKQIVQAPMVIGNEILVATMHDGLLCLDGATGTVKWNAPSIASVMSVSPTHIYAQDYFRSLVSMHRKNGQIHRHGPPLGNAVVASNGVNDRAYVVDTTGRIVCLRETVQRWPHFHPQPKQASVEVESSPGSDGQPTPPATSPAVTNPFAIGDDNPFDSPSGSDGDSDSGSDSAPTPENDNAIDPFGASDDPFGL